MKRSIIQFVSLVSVLLFPVIANSQLEELVKKAEQGDALAQYSLGVMYYESKGVPQDYKKAIEWYTKAAEQGLDHAQYNLGQMYYEDKGVPQDYKKAYAWAHVAEASGNQYASQMKRGLFSNDLSRQELKEALVMAGELSKRLSKNLKRGE